MLVKLQKIEVAVTLWVFFVLFSLVFGLVLGTGRMWVKGTSLVSSK